MMFRATARLFLALAVLGSLCLSSNGARAQTTPNDLIPHIQPVADVAFGPSSGAGVMASTTRTVETGRLAAAEAFTDLMLRWQADEPAGSTLQLEIRASADGATWSRWGTVEVSDDPAGADDPADTRWSDPIHADPSQFFQLRATLTANAGGEFPAFSGLQVHSVDTRVANEQPPQPTAGAEMSALAVARPAYVSRTSWGSPDGEGSRAPVARRAVTHLIVHHTADSSTLSSSEPNWAARVRAYWSFHAITRGWGDIGYNWLIDPNGVIYAGRSGSTDDTSAGGAVGFHDTANYGSMGVSVIGTYTSMLPTAAAQNSLVNLLAWKASQRGINPNGSDFYYGCSISSYCAPKVPGSNVPNIAGHRQVTPGRTTCPGDAFMGIMQSIRDRVVSRINGTPDDGNNVIDELEPSFSSSGSWNDAACGYGGHTKWTYTSSAYDGVPNTNVGIWRPNLKQSGSYKLRIHIPQGCGLGPVPDYATSNARYEVGYSGGKVEQLPPVDQRTAQPYLEFGPFPFDAGTGGYVKLTDLTNEPYTGDRTKDKVIFFDAIEWIPQEQVRSAQLVSARLQANTVPIGGVLQVEFVIKNTGTMPLDTQAPLSGTQIGPLNGWIYDESECFAGSSGSTEFPKDSGRLRTTLGFTDLSQTVQATCNADNGDYPWRWGLRTALQPGEQRTVVGYVRFRTQGTYSFEANLVNEYVKYYGSDGNGTSIRLGPVTVKEFPYKAWLPPTQR